MGTEVNRIVKNNQFVAIALIVLAVASRWLPHPPNVAPVTAVALLSATYLDKKWALVVPLISLLISDLVIGFYGMTMFFVYGSFLLTSVIGFVVRKKPTLLKLAVATVASSVLFFLVTNFGVWVEGQLYVRSWSGFVECYVAAIPFFRNTLIGDVFYTVLLFGLYRLLFKDQTNSAQQTSQRSFSAQ